MTREPQTDGALQANGRADGTDPVNRPSPDGACDRRGKEKDETGIDWVPPAEIRVPASTSGIPSGPREPDVVRLQAALAETGRMLHPITVRPAPETKEEEAPYELVAGRVRLAAAVRLGWERVPCRVFQLSDRDVTALSTIEDWSCKEAPQLVQAWAIHRTLEETGWSQADLSRMTSLTPGKVSELVAYAHLIEPDDVSKISVEFDASAEQVCELSRADLRSLRRARSEGEEAFRAALGQVLTDGEEAATGDAESPESSDQPDSLEVADGCVRIDRVKLNEMGGIRLALVILRTVIALIAPVLTSRFFAILRDAK